MGDMLIRGIDAELKRRIEESYRNRLGAERFAALRAALQELDAEG